MAVRAVSDRRTPAVVVPDAAFWASRGIDLRAIGIRDVPAPHAADALVLPEELPAELVAGSSELSLQFGGEVRPLAGSMLRGVDPTEALASARGDEEGSHDDDDGGGDGGGSDDHDGMMEVSGEPSADGLIMEDADARIGPISAALPIGLTARIRLDGDVVADCELRSELSPPPDAPDPLARAAFGWAHARANGDLSPADTARHLAATEVERALSHAMWLAGFGRLLGWAELHELALSAAAPIIDTHRQLTIHPGDSRPSGLDSNPALEKIAASLPGSRRLASRTEALGALDRKDSGARALAGPAARASGVPDDLRGGDPAYAELEFEPVVGTEGDSRERVLVRAEEALRAWRLAADALARGELPVGGVAVEGPRGPVAYGERGPLARGGDQASRAAAALAGGHEISRALVVISSFDLSPWRVAS